MTDKIRVTHMFLCEASHVFLKPGVHYMFEVMDGCKECEKLAKLAAV